MSWNNVYPHDECGICMNQYHIHDNITWFPCNHCVCVKCYLQCTTCPICRAPFDSNIKPPIFAKINDITIHIEKNRMNNTDVTNLQYELNQLRSLV